MIENTSQRDPLLHLLGAMSDGGNGYIEGQEAAGQRQIVASQELPVKGGIDAELLALGFTLGEPDGHDPLFRPATLPAGWKREGSDHNMWSYIADQHGRRRVAIFYKAAFYDRRAGMHLETVQSYLRTCLHDNAAPVISDEWCTSETVREALSKLRDAEIDQRNEARLYVANQPKDTYWPGRISEHDAEIAKIDALADRIGVTL